MLLGVEGMAMRMAVREELSLWSGLIICEIVKSVGQEKVREFQKPLAVATMYNERY